MNCLRLLQEMQSPELDYDRLNSIISQDVSFSYKLLRYVNSALFARYGETRSITQALVRLGEDAIRHWVALAALPVLAKDKPGELVTHSLVRARFFRTALAVIRPERSRPGVPDGFCSLYWTHSSTFL